MEQDKNKGGRPLREATEEELQKIEQWAKTLRTDEIAGMLGIERSTFFRMRKRDPRVLQHYKRGRTEVVSQIAGSLIQQALDGNIQAAIFYLKTQAGWSSGPSVDLELSGDERPTQIADKVIQKASRGDITPEQATALQNAIKSRQEISVNDEISERLSALENKVKASE